MPILHTRFASRSPGWRSEPDAEVLALPSYLPGRANSTRRSGIPKASRFPSRPGLQRATSTWPTTKRVGRRGARLGGAARRGSLFARTVTTHLGGGRLLRRGASHGCCRTTTRRSRARAAARRKTIDAAEEQPRLDLQDTASMRRGRPEPPAPARRRAGPAQTTRKRRGR